MTTYAERSRVQMEIALRYQARVERRRGQRDGVVVTPVEVVDYQVRSVIEQLQAHDGWWRRAQVLDPFGGTGIYLARMLQLAPLTPSQKTTLAGRCRMVEIDPEACAIASANLREVTLEETGQAVVVPRVICADSFTLGDEVWAA